MDALIDRLRSTLDELPADARRRLAQALGLVGDGSAGGVEGELVAVVRPEGGTPDGDALRHHLRERLPDYMVPRRFVFVDALPRTPAGKLDRKALEALLDQAPDAPGEPEAGVLPRTDAERTLAGIWAEVLGSEVIYVHDDFFELGGDSLLSIRIIARAKQAGLDIDPGRFFETPTVAALATHAGEPADGANGIGSRSGNGDGATRTEASSRGAVESRGTSLNGAGGTARTSPNGAGVTGAAREPAETPSPAFGHPHGEATASLPRLPTAGDGPCPLTAAQEGFWFLDRLDPGNPAYNVAVRLDLTGPLDPGALARSWDRVLARHDGLRATVRVVDGDPFLDVLPPERFPLERMALDGPPDPDRATPDGTADPEARVDARAREVAGTRFDLAGGPLVRGVLCTLGPSRHVLLLALHHMVVDGESVRLLLGELSAGVRRAAGDGEAPSIRDYAVWERSRLASGAVEASRRYWLDQLADVPERMELPGDTAPGDVLDGEGILVRMLPAEVADAVAEVGAREGCTPFVLLLTLYQLLLRRHTGHDVVVTGTPVRHRPHPALEEAIGYFQNMVALRTDFSGDPDLREALSRVRRTVADALAHRDVPFERLVAELAPDRPAGSTPLFQTAFTYRDGTRGEDWRTALDLPGVDVEADILPTGAAKFELALEVERTTAGLRMVTEYAPERVRPSTVEALLDRFEVLLRAALEQPGGPVGALPVLTPEDRRLSLEAWGTGPAAAAEDPTVRDRMEAMAARAPDRVAVSAPDGELTRGELDTRANRLAHLLRARGVGPETRVAVALHPSAEWIVALLAVWKAGGAFLSLDPDHPPARTRRILENLDPVLVVTRGGAGGGRGSGAISGSVHGIDVLDLDRERAELDAQPTTSPGIPLDGASLAYVIYTSGSTGTPKGVEVEHGSLANLATWHREEFEVTEEDRAPQLASPTFDASVWETWANLAAGATLVIAPRGIRTDPGAILGWLDRQGVTVAFLSTPVAEATFQLPGPLPETLRVLAVGGDQLRTRLPADVPVRLVNLYGPTECTVISTAGTVAPAPTAGLPSIGGPIRGTRVFVLDARGRPVPPGVPGELCIAGRGLARGYRGDPEATAAAFRPAGFPEAEGERLYHTGDRVRFRPDGTLEFQGRLDRQTKIRGQRIEPGEVEATLLDLPGVTACAVEVREERPGEKGLVAFVVTPGETPPTPAELRDALAARLPSAMVPTRIVPLPELPLTASGKLDRNALPAIGPAVGSGEPPRGPVEEVVAAVWTEVLGRLDPGRHDDFFALGGHSLKVTAMVARLERLFDVRLPLARVFEAPTIAALATLVEALRERESDTTTTGATGTAPSPDTTAADPDGPRPLAPDQARLWYLQQLDPSIPLYHVPLVHRLTGPLDVAALEEALDALRRRHEALRTVVDAGDGEPVQVVQPAEGRPLLLTDLTAWEGSAAELDALIRDEIAEPFDPAVGPLFRARLFRTGEEEHVLVLTLHHLVADGWSVGILARELSALYAGAMGEDLPPLEPVPARYGDWCAAQTVRDHEGDLAYWRDRLRDVPPLDLPTDHPRPARPSYRGGLHAVRLDPALSDGLLALCREAGVTPFMLLLAAFEVLLQRTSGQTDLAVGTVVAGRGAVETEAMVGLFANTVVLRTEVEPELAFREVLARVRRTCIEALAHQRVPFGRVVEAVQPPRDPSRNPLFQVMFVLQNQDPPTLALPGVDAEPVVPELGTSRFDLTVTAEPTGDTFTLHLEYATELFEAETVEALGTHFTTLLAGIVARPDDTVAALPMVEDPREWSLVGPALPLAPEDTIHRRISRQAAETPDAPAVRGEDGEVLRYREIEAGSDRVARVLRARGIGPGDVVAVGLPRTPELVAALLGILKAGAAYLPLDPDFPAPRLRHIVDDAGAALLLTSEALSDRLPDGLDRLLLRDVLAGDGEIEDGGPFPAVGASDLAYLIYTSGSTGGPKGVEVTHGNAVNLLETMARRPGLAADSRLLAVTTLSFDISVLEIFGPLGVGGEVVLARARTAGDGRVLRELMEEVRPTVMQATPSTWRMLLDVGWEGDEALRVLVGGEALPPELARMMAGCCGEVWNMYGPTETTIWSTCWRVDASADGVRIGDPVANTRVYVLDDHLRPVPRGVPGELYIAGAGVTAGYRHRPELTSGRFLPDPFSDSPEDRMYRTGDRVRAHRDGTLEFLGRRDGQVKIRGYRVEVAEVEEVLAAHRSVRQAVVKAFGVGTPDARLVAYVTTDADTPVTGSELRRAVRDHLPDYMVPGMVSLLDAFPTTPNGKVDRGALEDPLNAARREAPAHRPPATGAERVVAEVWSELLPGVEVGRDDNFFELGGHSLLSIRAVHEIERRTGRTLDPRAFFFQSVEQLGAALDAEEGAP